MFRHLLCVLMIYVSQHSVAQRLTIQRIEAEPVFDGAVYDEVWNGINSLPYTQHSPNFGSEPSERTDVKLAYDDNFLYVGARMYDAEKPQTFALSRDGGSWTDDWIGIALDTYNDKENAMGFFTTPGGLRQDLAILDGGVNNIGVNFSWNAFWEVKTTIDSLGWTAEFRIPLSTLRFQVVDGKTVMGLICWRQIARLSEFNIYPAIPPTFGGLSFFKVSQSQEIEFEGLTAQNPVYLTPYVLGGYGNSHVHNEDKSELIAQEEVQREFGIDLKYNVSSNLILDATYNTDFAQVEADDQQVNLSRFSLFFPEKRNFFMERSSSFEMNFSGNNKVFYSRKIGINGTDRVRILGGLRLVGRIGKWDVGVLNMQTENTQQFPTENLGTMRIRRQVFNSNSYIGLIGTSRLSKDGYNSVYGVDGILRLFGDEFLSISYAQSLTNTAHDLLDRNTSRFYGRWERRRQVGFAYATEVEQVGHAYDPGLGFEGRYDFISINANVNYTWYPESKSIFNHNLMATTWQIYNDRSGILESAQHRFLYRLQDKVGLVATVEPRNNYEFISDTIALGGNTEILPGSFVFNDINIGLNSPEVKKLTLYSNVEYGQFYDGFKQTAVATLQWNLSKYLELSGTYIYNNVNFEERGLHFRNNIMRFKARVMFNTVHSINSFVQYNDANQSFNVNFRFRYNPTEGHDLFVVYNQSELVGRYRIQDINPSNQFNLLMVKYLYTFIL